jgi:endonuclease YncB( thermonuclease family)
MKNSKRRGEWAELQFMAKAAKFGLWISKPRGELARYDMVIPSQRMRKAGPPVLERLTRGRCAR